MRRVRRHVLASMMRKEFAQALRDRRMRGVLFGAPIILLVVLGYAVNTDVRDIPFALLDRDKSSLSRGLAERFTASGYFRLQAAVDSLKEFDPLMNEGRIEAFIHIPSRFSKTIARGGTAELQVIIDGTDSNRAAIISAYVHEIIREYVTPLYADRVRASFLLRTSGSSGGVIGQGEAPMFFGSVQCEERVWYNPELVSRNFFLPGIIGFIISMMTIMLTSMSIVKERESGTIEQIIVSPITPQEFILGKTIPFAVIGFIDMLVVTIISITWFDVPFKGSMIFLIAAALLYIVSTLSIGMYISTISRTQQQAMMSFFLFFIPAILFSGFVFPIYAMPAPIQPITYFNPLMYFIVIIRGVFLKGVGVTALWKECLALLVIGVTLLVMSVRRVSRRLE